MVTDADLVSHEIRRGGRVRWSRRAWPFPLRKTESGPSGAPLSLVFESLERVEDAVKLSLDLLETHLGDVGPRIDH